MQWYCRLVMKNSVLDSSLQLDSQILETGSPRTHKPKIVNESLEIVARIPDFAAVSMHDMHRLALLIHMCPR